MKDLFDLVKHLVAIVIVGYVVLSLGAFVGGMLNAAPDTSILTHGSKCSDDKPPRIVKYFPAYKLGCYLGTPEGEPYYYQEPTEKERQCPLN